MKLVIEPYYTRNTRLLDCPFVGKMESYSIKCENYTLKRNIRLNTEFDYSNIISVNCCPPNHEIEFETV